MFSRMFVDWSSVNRLGTVFPLRCEIQKYAWGKIGQTSEVAKLAPNSCPGFNLEPGTTYAELWMGTHPNGPSTILIPGAGEMSLEDWVKQNPEKLGEKVNKTYKGALPFLFKVLSVNTALSIQAHPNKIRAEQLHRDHPETYKDANHKPEMAIALTEFQGLCGFRPIQEIAAFMQKIEEFRTVVDNHNAVKLMAAARSMDMPLHREAIKECFTAMMLKDQAIVNTQLKFLVDRVKAMECDGEDTSEYVGDVLLKLDQEFPGDRGAFAIFFLNVVTLKPGEAMFLEANLPHCYLSGDCMECMACSDNVVRAGLTGKPIDVDTLCKMLEYGGRPANKMKFPGKVTEQDGCKVTHFVPPIWDFTVTRYEVPSAVQSCSIPKNDSAGILICVNGEGAFSNDTVDQPIQIRNGTVLFISAYQEASLKVNSDGMLVFLAHAG